jgi:hypothetical protein
MKDTFSIPASTLRVPLSLVAGLLFAGAGIAAEPPSLDVDVPAGMVTFFETETCPAGWSRPQYARGRLLMFDIKSHSGKPVNEPMAAGVAPRHTHAPLTVSFTLPEQEVRGANGCSNDAPVAPGARNVVDYSAISASDLNLPFVHLTACEKSGKDAARDPLPLETYGFFDRDSCPAQWEACGPPVCPSIAGRFAMPLIPGGRTGLVAGEGWTDPSPAGGHPHTVGGTLTPKSYGVVWFLGGNSRAASGERKFQGTAPVPGRSVDGGGGLLPYVRLLGCIKTGLVAQAADRLAPGMTIFHGGQSNCPGGWRPTPETAGRFVVASPAGAEPFQKFGSSVPLSSDGERRSHKHPFASHVELQGSDLCLNGGGDQNLAHSGTYRIQGQTDPAVADVPYVQLRQCTVEHPPRSSATPPARPTTHGETR